MIRDIIIKNDPFIGSFRLVDIPKGLVQVVDDIGGIASEEFLLRLADYLDFIREDKLIDWSKKLNDAALPEFFITWKHDKEVYGYRLHFNPDGLIASERLFLEKKGEFVLMAEFRKGLPILHNPFWSVDCSVGNDLFNLEIPDGPYPTPLMREVEPLRTLMLELGFSKLQCPKKVDGLKFNKEHMTDEQRAWFASFLMASDFGLEKIYGVGEAEPEWQFFKGLEDGRLIEFELDTFGSGFNYLVSTLPYLQHAVINNGTFIDPNFTTCLHHNLELFMWKELKAIEGGRSWQILTRYDIRDNSKSLVKTLRLESD